MLLRVRAQDEPAERLKAIRLAQNTPLGPHQAVTINPSEGDDKPKRPKSLWCLLCSEKVCENSQKPKCVGGQTTKKCKVCDVPLCTRRKRAKGLPGSQTGASQALTCFEIFHQTPTIERPSVYRMHDVVGPADVPEAVEPPAPPPAPLQQLTG